MTSAEERKAWHNALFAMPIDKFLNRLTRHLGKMQTPFHKQRLIEQLESYLANAQTQSRLVGMLDKADAAIITVIALIASPTRAVISDMIGYLKELVPHHANRIEGLNTAQILAHIELMEDAFIIYRSTDMDLQSRYRLTPPLREAVLPLVDAHILVPLVRSEANDCALPAQANGGRECNAASECGLSDGEIAAVIAFALSHKKVCKKDGTFTVAAAKDAAMQFPNGGKRQEGLLRGMINLSLALEGENAISFNWAKLRDFAALPPYQRGALLCAAQAVPTRDSDAMGQVASILLDCAATVAGDGIQPNALKNLIRLLLQPHRDGANDETAGDALPRYAMNTRLNRLLNAGRRGDRTAMNAMHGTDGINAEMLDVLSDALEAARDANYITESAGRVYHFHFGNMDSASQTSQTSQASGSNDGGHLVSIDASFTVTVMPGVTLQTMLNILPFLTLVSCQTASQYIITKDGATRAFDAGYTTESIMAALRSCIGETVSDSLAVSLESWHEAYLAATLYRGYVLTLTESAARRFEHSIEYDKYVLKKLSSGVYLLNVQAMPLASSDNEAIKASSQCGFKYIDTVHAARGEAEKSYSNRQMPLPQVRAGRNLFAD